MFFFSPFREKELILTCLLCCCLIVGTSLSVWATPPTPQTDHIETLLDQLNQEIGEEERMLIHGELSKAFFFTDIEKSLEYANRAYELADRLGLENRKALYMEAIGVNLAVSAKYLEGERYLREALLLSEELGDTLQIGVHANLGGIYQDLAVFDLARFHFERSIHLADSFGYPKESIPPLGSLASLSVEEEAYAKALFFQRKAMKLAREFDFEVMLVYGYKNMGPVFLELGFPDSALWAEDQAIALSRDKYPSIHADALVRKSDIFRSLSRYPEAVQAATEGLSLAQSTNSGRINYEAECSLGKTYLKTLNFDAALQHAFRALQFSQEYKLTKEEAFSFGLISEMYHQQGDHNNAYQYLLKANQLQTDLTKEERKWGQIFAMRSSNGPNRPQSEQQEGHLSFLERSHGFELVMVFVVCFALLAFLLLYLRKQKTVFFHHLSVTDIDKRIRFARHISLVAILLMIPVLIYLVMWGTKEVIGYQLLLGGFLLVIYLGLKKDNYQWGVLLIMLGLYPLCTIQPWVFGPLLSSMIAPVGIFLAINYLSSKPWHVVGNSVLFVMSFGVSFLFGRQAEEPFMQGNPETLDAMISVIIVAAIIMTIIYHNLHLADFHRELSSKNDFLQRITDLNPHFLFAKDLNRRYTFVNDAMALNFGLSKAEILGKTSEELRAKSPFYFPEQDDHYLLELNHPMIQENKVVASEDGTSKNIDLIKKPLHDAQGKVIGLIGVASDLTDRIQAEKALQEREAMLRTVMDSIPDPILALDLTGQPLMYNKRVDQNFFKWRGVDPTQPIPWETYFPQDAVNKMTMVLERAQKGETINYITNLEGGPSPLCLDLTFAPIMGLEGQILGVVMAGRDISELKEKENALQNSQSTYKTLFHNMFDGVMVYDYHKECIKDANRVVYDLFGFEPDENLQSYSRFDLLPKFLPNAPEINVLDVANEHRDKVLEGKSVQSDVVFVRQNGELFHAEVSILPSFGDANEAMVVIRDVTKARQGQWEIEERQQIYQSLIELSFDGIDIVEIHWDRADPRNFEGELLVRNQKMTEIIGSASEPMVHLSTILSQTVPIQKNGQDSKSYLQDQFKSLYHDRYLTCDWELQTEDGIRECELVAHLINVNNKTLLIRIIKDLTGARQQQAIIQKQVLDLNTSNAKLKKYIESNMNLENFAYLASHDLKAPIRTVVSFTQLLERSLKNRLETHEKEFLDFIVSATRNMEQLVNDLLSYSRVNTTNLTLEDLATKPLLQEVVRELQQEIEEKKGTIHLGELPSIVYADRVKLRQLFQNLIANALKFSRPGIAPQIDISGKSLGEEKGWEFVVKDNGVGIEKEFQDKIFMIFRRLNREAEGTGIGLAMCKKIVEQHGGSIGVRSKLGQGSEFAFTLRKT